MPIYAGNKYGFSISVYEKSLHRVFVICEFLRGSEGLAGRGYVVVWGALLILWGVYGFKICGVKVVMVSNTALRFFIFFIYKKYVKLST